mmetsp:Transcript_862/g.3416  ORF Transcript_862/g.3416 Transcript_862/m.3416 type:complete len:202 (-) Transcript_862:476-1081(-)
MTGCGVTARDLRNNSSATAARPPTRRGHSCGSIGANSTAPCSQRACSRATPPPPPPLGRRRRRRRRSRTRIPRARNGLADSALAEATPMRRPRPLTRSQRPPSGRRRRRPPWYLWCRARDRSGVVAAALTRLGRHGRPPRLERHRTATPVQSHLSPTRPPSHRPSIPLGSRLTPRRSRCGPTRLARSRRGPTRLGSRHSRP